MPKYTVTHDSATVREYQVEAETPDQAVELVKTGKAKLVNSSSSETHLAREPFALGAGGILGAGIGHAFRTDDQREKVTQ